MSGGHLKCPEDEGRNSVEEIFLTDEPLEDFLQVKREVVPPDENKADVIKQQIEIKK